MNLVKQPAHLESARNVHARISFISIEEKSVSMEEKGYSDGVYDFRRLVGGSYHFVDKTMLIEDVCDADGKVLLYTRPRRFGKSISLSMLDCFFNIKYRNDSDLFSGLKIESCERCMKHRNAYPVIRMDFSRLTPSSPESFEDSLKGIVSKAADEIMKGIDLDSLAASDLRILERCSSRDLGESDLNSSISDMCEILEEAHGSKAMILVDEYDHCIQNIPSKDLYDDMVKRLRPLMEQTFKTNYHLRTGVVTGIMPLTKAGMLSGFNNPVVCDILSTNGEERFGFTESEVEDLLMRSGNDLPGVLEEIRDWYDGYRFGNAEVYNPYSVIRYLDSRTREDKAPARMYWEGSTGAGMSAELMSNLDGIALQELSSMYNDPGTKIRTTLDEFLAYHELAGGDADPGQVYSYLAMAGYLRADPTGEVLESGRETYEVGMVNREIRSAFGGLVRRAAGRRAEVRRDLKAHVLSGDPDKIRDDLQFVLGGHAMDRSWSEEEAGRSAHDWYKASIASAFRASGMAAMEEVPKGFGECDVFVPANGNEPAVIVEIKTSSKAVPEESADKAYSQIMERGYAAEPLDGDAVWIALGINGKRVSVITPKDHSSI